MSRQSRSGIWTYEAAIREFLGIALIALSFALPWTAVYGDWVTGWELLRAGFSGAIPWYFGIWPGGVAVAVLVAFMTRRLRVRYGETLAVVALSAATALEAAFLIMISSQSYGGSDRVVLSGAIVGSGQVFMWVTAARTLVGRFRKRQLARG